MQIETIRFGQVEVDENKLIQFREGLPGLDEYRRFALLQFAESYPIFWLQCVDDGDICLPVIDSFQALGNYAFNLSDEDVADLDLQGPEDLHIISVLVIPENIEQMTVNLAAPIIINIHSGEARQIILSGGEYAVRQPIFREICRLIQEEEAKKAAAVDQESEKKEGEADAGIVEED